MEVCYNPPPLKAGDSPTELDISSAKEEAAALSSFSVMSPASGQVPNLPLNASASLSVFDMFFKETQINQRFPDNYAASSPLREPMIFDAISPTRFI